MTGPTYWREIDFQKGYNNRGKPGGGVEGMVLHFRFHGPLGTTQFSMATGWVPGEVARSYPEKDHPSWARVCDMYPSGRDLGYHWLTPQWPGQEEYRRDDCPFVPGGQCYYDGSGRNADPVLAAFVDRGEPAVWRELVRYYRQLRDEQLERVSS